ncbi:MAG: hypothetical protein IKG93_10745 [Clostridiales bacterium]|nr:hypothetical protein [Clostridiales bacterium]
MKHSSEQVREVGSSRQSGKREIRDRDLSIGDVLRRHNRELITKRLLVAVVIILLITLGVFLVVSGFFGRFVDTLMGFVD